jgi:hypothetical protein
MVVVSNLGWPVPQNVRTLGAHEQTVRKYAETFMARDLAGLPDPFVQLPADYQRERPRVTVLETYSVHCSKPAQSAADGALAAHAYRLTHSAICLFAAAQGER